VYYCFCSIKFYFPIRIASINPTHTHTTTTHAKLLKKTKKLFRFNSPRIFSKFEFVRWGGNLRGGAQGRGRGVFLFRTFSSAATRNALNEYTAGVVYVSSFNKSLLAIVIITITRLLARLLLLLPQQ